MKTRIIALVIASLTIAHAHGPNKTKGPNGGRVIAGVEPHAEFLVTADKKLEIRFINDDGKVIAPAEQVVTVTTGERTKPVKLSFTKDGDKLVSDKPIPDSEEPPVVLQIKPTADGKTVTEKFILNLAKCPTCSQPEYACICGH